jgi:hypothetical protein
LLVSFEEYVANANSALTVDELLRVFLDTVKQHGYDKMIFCLLSDHKHIGLEAGVGHLRNYPGDWMKYYFEQGFDKVDPVISYCYQKCGTFTWQEMSERLDLTRRQKLCLNLGTEAGLNNGICTPLWGPHKFAGVGLATTEKKDACDANLDLITAYCNHFYIAFQRLHAKPRNPDDKLPNLRPWPPKANPTASSRSFSASSRPASITTCGIFSGNCRPTTASTRCQRRSSSA